MPKFEVGLIYRGRHTYIVEAEGVDEAADKAVELWQKGEEGVPTGAEYEQVDEDLRIKELEEN